MCQNILVYFSSEIIGFFIEKITIASSYKLSARGKYVEYLNFPLPNPSLSSFYSCFLIFKCSGYAVLFYQDKGKIFKFYF